LFPRGEERKKKKERRSSRARRPTITDFLIAGEGGKGGRGGALILSGKGKKGLTRAKTLQVVVLSSREKKRRRGRSRPEGLFPLLPLRGKKKKKKGGEREGGSISRSFLKGRKGRRRGPASTRCDGALSSKGEGDHKNPWKVNEYFSLQERKRKRKEKKESVAGPVRDLRGDLLGGKKGTGRREGKQKIKKHV